MLAISLSMFLFLFMAVSIVMAAAFLCGEGAAVSNRAPNVSVSNIFIMIGV